MTLARLARIGAILTALTALVLPATAAARSGWSATVRVAAAPLDALTPQIAFSPGGQAAVAGAFVNPDAAMATRATLLLLGARGSSALGSRREPLDLGWFGRQFVVLAGTSGGGRVCCRAIEVLAPGRHGYARTATLLRGLIGSAIGRLVPAGRGVLAAVGTAEGVWVAQARTGRRFGTPRRLTPAGAAPESLVATGMRAGRTMLAWAAGTVTSTVRTPAQSIVVATGTSTHAPAQPRTLLTLPDGEAASQLAVAAGPGAPTVAWVQGGFDSTGAYRAEIAAADVTGTPRERVFAQTGTVSGLTAGADPRGGELLAWKVCDPAPVCHVVAVSRGGGGRFSVPVTLGTIDAAAEPAVAVGPGGSAVVGWIEDGRVVVVRRGSAGAAFGAAKRLPGSGAAAGLALAGGPGGRVIAAWSDGTSATSVLAATFSPR